MRGFERGGEGRAASLPPCRDSGGLLRLGPLEGEGVAVVRAVFVEVVVTGGKARVLEADGEVFARLALALPGRSDARRLVEDFEGGRVFVGAARDRAEFG